MKNLFFLLLFIPCIAFSQNDYDQLVKEGLNLLKQEKIALALDKYNQAYLLDSSRVEANYGLGVGYAYFCHTYLKDCNKSIFFLDKSIKIDNSYRNSYKNRGGIKMAIKEYEAAIEDFNMAIKLNPKESSNYLGKATVFEKMGRLNEACKNLKKAAELGNPTASQILTSMDCH